MYEAFYGFKEKPFNLTPDPAFFYESVAHKRAAAYLSYGLGAGHGFLQLTGPPGCGKTTLVRALISRMGPGVRAVHLVNSRQTFLQLLRTIMGQLEGKPVSRYVPKDILLSRFHKFLLDQHGGGRSVVIILDEAQNLPGRTLEELRMLSNFETDKEKLLQIVLVAQPGLIERMAHPSLAQLAQRITLRFQLGRLAETETEEYVKFRLMKAGSNGQVAFATDACQLIHRVTRGVPRLINIACDMVLLAGYVADKKSFDREMVRKALKELWGSGSQGKGGGNGAKEEAGTFFAAPEVPKATAVLDTSPSQAPSSQGEPATISKPDFERRMKLWPLVAAILALVAVLGGGAFLTFWLLSRAGAG